jgi:hypothetical protein
MSRDLAKRFISSLPDEDLVAFMAEALASRREVHTHGPRTAVLTYCLARCVLTQVGEEYEEPALIELAARPSPGNDDEGRSEMPLNGECDACGTLVVALASLSICPLCEGTIECSEG